MASNDSGVDTSNDSNDGSSIAAVAAANPAMPPLPPNITHAVATAAAQSWHNINPNAFLLNARFDEFALPLSHDYQAPCIIRPSSLPSVSPSSHTYKMRKRAKERLRNILAESDCRKLRTAASTCNIELLTRILESGSDPNAADEYKRSPLHLAACRGYIQIVQQLLKFGANPNVVDSLGNTPLHLAVISASSNNFNVVVQILLQGGANVQVYDRSGKTPLDLAESKLRLLRTRYNQATPESAKILEDMCLLTTLILRYLVKQQRDLEDLSALEMQLQNLSTSDEPAQKNVVSQTADALLASVERMSIGK